MACTSRDEHKDRDYGPMMDVLDSYCGGIEYLLRRLGKDHAEYLNAVHSKPNERKYRCRATLRKNRKTGPERARTAQEINRVAMATLKIASARSVGSSPDSSPYYATRPLPLRIPSKSLDYFVGREAELRSIKRLLLRQDPGRLPSVAWAESGRVPLPAKLQMT